MITIRKLARQPDGPRRRKIVRLLALLEALLRGGDPKASRDRYWRELTELTAADASLPEGVRRHAVRVRELLSDSLESTGRAATVAPEQRLLRAVNDLRHALSEAVGREAADWDLEAPAGVPLGVQPSGGSAPVLHGARLFLERIRSPFNLGAIARTAAAFGLPELVLCPETVSPEQQRARRAAMGGFEMLATRRQPLEEVEALGLPILALETGGSPIGEYAFPYYGIVLVGSEELGLSPAALELADRSAGRVSIPAPGRKRSLNVAVAVGILLYCWHADLSRRER